MNAKRWVALGIVFALLIVSALAKFTSSQIASMEESSPTFVESLFADTGELTETVIEEGGDDTIAVLSVDGTIQDTGDSGSLLGGGGYDHSFFMQQLEQVRNDDYIQGVLLYVNSPGGGVMESAQIRDKILQIQKERNIPFYVSMGSMAASGGYYISAPADKIFASKETLTGSLGVIMQGYDYSELMKKLGVSDNTIKSGEYKDIMSGTRPMTEDEKKIMQSMIDDSYNEFVKVVAKGRGMSAEEVRKIADGRIYDGRQAKENGLIDEFGYQEDALEALKKEQGLADATVIQYDAPEDFSSLFSVAAQKISGQNADISQLIKLTGTLKAPRMMYLYGE
ncbi:signal peptide peptidase SppA [Listeria monocytogenes]|uniref:Signal peptide peptidase SppA n=1 Tax=Listeria monocytogenes TaxID=1639 RepID=A0AAN2X8T1_LISMN|nr:signal peptide peptidase SppA [Listeria monocytogenes]EAD2800554.1 signal peptide peptidase SppA [Listeria monocytogenes]EAD7211399.1 signal peptide peptidase SppA [Listeria monocytogenes]EAD7602700.1 signal peptide peptidase SppA [Listeria monocytogenes]EAE1301736.1 signal peptide peptidase SppA [Listeria monocytogenes]EAF0970334.1 signal peptide peptidase SppA [Listeria monocytogenes]